jgi:hypothetical protein
MTSVELERTSNCGNCGRLRVVINFSEEHTASIFSVAGEVDEVCFRNCTCVATCRAVQRYNAGDGLHSHPLRTWSVLLNWVFFFYSVKVCDGDWLVRGVMSSSLFPVGIFDTHDVVAVDSASLFRWFAVVKVTLCVLLMTPVGIEPRTFRMQESYTAVARHTCSCVQAGFLKASPAGAVPRTSLTGFT